jgi:hypothetical protein
MSNLINCQINHSSQIVVEKYPLPLKPLAFSKKDPLNKLG